MWYSDTKHLPIYKRNSTECNIKQNYSLEILKAAQVWIPACLLSEVLLDRNSPLNKLFTFSWCSSFQERICFPYFVSFHFQVCKKIKEFTRMFTNITISGSTSGIVICVVRGVPSQTVVFKWKSGFSGDPVDDAVRNSWIDTHLRVVAVPLPAPFFLFVRSAHPVIRIYSSGSEIVYFYYIVKLCISLEILKFWRAYLIILKV